MAGDFRGVDTPVLVPNTEVKGSFAEGSAGLARASVGRRRLFSFHRGASVQDALSSIPTYHGG